jgi:DNA-binding MarR family transcriptional regulator
MIDTKTEATTNAWRLFLQAHSRLLGALEHEMETERCLPLSWYDVLAQLNRAPGGRLRMQDLVNSLVLSKSGLTRRIDRMVEAGLVQRATCPGDRRGVYAVLTPAGRERLEHAWPVHDRGVQEHFTRYLTDEEAQVLQSVFQKVLDGLAPMCETVAAQEAEAIA